MVDFTREVVLAQIAFGLAVIALVLVSNVFGKRRSDSDHKQHKER